MKTWCSMVKLPWASAGALAVVMALSGCPAPNDDPLLNDVAQEWMALCRQCIAVEETPTVDARTVFHLSATMYEAWAAYDETATGYFSGHRLKVAPDQRSLSRTHETLSHAAYALLTSRFARLGSGEAGPEGEAAFAALRAKMESHGYVDTAGAPVLSEAQALGALIGDIVLEYGADDGANESNGYEDTTGYAPLNNLIASEDPGTNGMAFPNNWAPLLPAGAVEEQSFLTPHWGAVETFALGAFDEDEPRIPAPDPPLYGTGTEGDYIDDAIEVLRISGSVDPTTGPGAAMVNLSPRVRGIDTPGIAYDARGHGINPYTRAPYDDHLVPLGDYIRALAMYQDGHNFTSPPPWWMEVASDLMRGDGVVARRPANKTQRYDLEYDVKLYFAVATAIHDAAVNCWDIKRRFDSPRPISQIRFLDEAGKLPVEPGFIEVIQAGDPLAGENDEFVGRFKVMAWTGPNGGVDWIRAAEWRPYQALDFSNPPFPAYHSGHTNMARAAAEALTAITGDPFLPGGLGKTVVDELPFEDDLSTVVELQWATYQDMADEVAFARLCTGVHVRADMIPARETGAIIGQLAAARAFDYFDGRGVAVSKRFQ